VPFVVLPVCLFGALSRYEFHVIEDLGTHEWDFKNHIRSRFAAEIPLTSGEKAWHPNTWYALINVEPFYTFDEHAIDPLCVNGGMAYIVSHHLRLEFLYYGQFTRPNGGNLAFTENIFRLNIKVNLRPDRAHCGPAPAL
jgi:hypothetical protein